MALQIPIRYVQALNDIRNLPVSAVDELARALASVSIVSSSSDMAARITESVPNVPTERLEPIVDALYSMYHVREFSEMNRSSFLNELTESLREQLKPKIADAELATVKEKFKKLLSIDTLDSLSKAVRLQRDEPRVFCASKIISDIRPVFGDNVKARPVAATITHTLKLSYHEDGDHKEFYIVLDEVDLSELEKTVKRAKTKADTLSQVLIDSSIPRLGI
jgi:hypothetical protein